LPSTDRVFRRPQLRHHRIGAIAFATGFNDLSHFSRAYRARYGLSPRATRAAIGSAAVADT
jgi:AraC family transcriptional activator of tynA and feaB